MPCCAFAAFIVGQILVGLNAAKRFLFGASADAEVRANPATEWSLSGGAPVPSSAAKPAIRLHGTRWFAVAAVIETALVLGGAYGLHAHFAHHAAAHHQAASLHKGR